MPLLVSAVNISYATCIYVLSDMYSNISSATRMSCRMLMEEVGVLGWEQLEWISTWKKNFNSTSRTAPQGELDQTQKL